jgi:hypothetical protein
MAALNPEEARAYLARWDLVRQVEVAELRGTSLDTKLKQLEALVGSRHLFNPDPCAQVEDVEIQARWSRLRQARSA